MFSETHTTDDKNGCELELKIHCTDSSREYTGGALIYATKDMGYFFP